MPYGLPKQINTPANNTKIERCVADLVQKGRDKTLAIRICKASIMGTAKRKKK